MDSIRSRLSSGNNEPLYCTDGRKLDRFWKPKWLIQLFLSKQLVLCDRNLCSFLDLHVNNSVKAAKVKRP